MKKQYLLFISLLITLPLYSEDPSKKDNNNKSIFACEQNKTIEKQSTIILLNGTSGAGKTSVAQALQALFKDSAGQASCEQTIMQVVFEQAQAHGFNLSKLQANLSVFQQWVTSHWDQATINKMMEEASKRFTQQVQTLLQTKQYIIIDEAALNQNEIELYEKYGPIFKVLLYCPITILPYHILAHNRAVPEDQKSLSIALSQFTSLYYPESLDYHTLAGCITLEDINRTFMTRDIRVFPHMSLGEIDVTMKTLLSIFKAHFSLNSDDIYLAPRLPHNLILNSGISSPEECARLIASQLEKTNTNNQKQE